MSFYTGPHVTMRTPDFFRDSVVGQILYYGTGRRWPQYPEDLSDFKIPTRFLGSPPRSRPVSPTTQSEHDSTTLDGRRQSMLKPEELEDAPKVLVVDTTPDRAEESAVGREYLHPTDPEKVDLVRQEVEEELVRNPYIVHWYGPDDPECPQNVSHHVD